MDVTEESNKAGVNMLSFLVWAQSVQQRFISDVWKSWSSALGNVVDASNKCSFGERKR